MGRQYAQGRPESMPAKKKVKKAVVEEEEKAEGGMGVDLVVEDDVGDEKKKVKDVVEKNGLKAVVKEEEKAEGGMGAKPARWTEQNFKRTHGHRGISLSVYQERMRAVNANGQPVQLELTSIGHGRDRLLVLLVDHSFPEFVHLCTSAYAEEELAKGNVYHISLCYEYEVYDWAVVDRVRSKFSGRRGVLHVHVENSAAYLIQDGALSTSILNDYDIWSLNHYGFYGDRGLHMSL
jgi:hypothetical protein